MVSILESGQVSRLIVRGDLLVAEKTDGTRVSALKEAGTGTIETLQILGASPETLATLPLMVEEPSTLFSGSFLFTVLILTLIGFLLFRSTRQGGHNRPRPLDNIGRSNPRVSSKTANKDAKMELPQVTFADVAGIEQAKFELQEIVEFLKDPWKFAKLGARVPRGVLMAGRPGTGKTLLAKAVAGEANVPFFSISGSEFVEMYVGVGAARVRDLFKRASERAPAVIFVDEIDAVGRRRGSSMGNGNDEREQTLNQILVEMDGFGSNVRIIVMAATNRPDILDPALLRPGRFDRKVILDQPDARDREAILKVHVQGKPLAEDVVLASLAKLTPGFVGADLENLVNEAAILAARRDLTAIGYHEFQDAMERIVAGPEHKGKIISETERKIVAYHEAGHAVVMYNLSHSDPVHKVSIISRGMGLGYTMPMPAGDRYLRSREAFEDDLTALLGGRVAEEIVFQQITTGAANDLERATKLAWSMVTRYGFSKKLSLRTFGDDQDQPYLGSLGEVRNYSEEMAQRIDEEVCHILDSAYHRAKQLITTHQAKLEVIAEALLEYETVERAHFENLMTGRSSA